MKPLKNIMRYTNGNNPTTNMLWLSYGLSHEQIEAVRDEYYDAGWKAAKREAVRAVENI